MTALGLLVHWAVDEVQRRVFLVANNTPNGPTARAEFGVDKTMVELILWCRFQG